MSDHDVSVAMGTTHDPAHPSQTHHKTHRNSTVNSHAASTTHRRKGSSTHAHPADTIQHPHPHTHTHASAKAAPGSGANGSSAARPPKAKASTTNCRPRTAKAAAARAGSRGSNDDAAMTSTSTQKSKNTTTAPSTGASESAEALGRLLQNALAAHTRTTTDHNSHEPNSHSHSHEPNSHNHVDRGIHTVDSRIGQGGQPQHTAPSGTSPMDGAGGQVSTTGTDTNVSRQLGQAGEQARRGSGDHGNDGWVYGAKAEWRQGEALDDGCDDGRAGDQQLRRRSQQSTDSTTQETSHAHTSAHDAHMDNAIALSKNKSTGVTASVDGQGREGAYVYAGSMSAAHDTHMTPQQDVYHPHEQNPNTQQQPCTQAQPYGNNTKQHSTVGDSNTPNTTTAADHRPHANAQQHTHTHAPSHTHSHAHAHIGPHETHSTGAAYAHIHSGNSGGSRSRKNSERDSDTGDGKKIKRIRRPPSEIERAYVCDVTECDKGYGSQGALDLHRKTKHDIKKGKDLHSHSSADLWSG
ncbi:hypothetical protein SARC_04235 [Sphaeroforma arctica JP610]|uniref:C2H2-type domain-containing protein n=1 Tax=Sphaeroforma arctica JP610 TaxID=667725 RepID=A0A0L0G3S1_9EUKA|nr:hypothetical protein SARC_04235 [Sphaeroforma arctica JP610]KNC83504.1 hypothetical protein SARC_04235 [Sphaeroforma arctica JP610]|eukprot:XP_014157406.1 hypothetical protein SARC_04235 [Sphaeroforma arctica JP610]